MTTTTTAELAAVSGTDLTTLAPAARAAVALRSEQTRKDLALLVEQSASITAVLNADGREQAHRVAMTLKGARVTIEKTGKEARDDATKFSKAVIAEEKDLIAVIEPEEARILALRDAWDAQVAAEKAAKIAAERARVEAIQADIQAIRSAPLAIVGKTAAEILALRDEVRDTIIGESFAEFSEQAMVARSEAFNALEAAHAKAVEAEAAAHAAEEARRAEVARIEAERAELAQLRAAAAETARVRAEQEERDRAAADAQRQLAEQAAELEAQRAAFAREQAEAIERAEAAAQLDHNHVEGLLLNAQFDADREVDRACLQTLAGQRLVDALLPPPESLTEADALIDAGGRPGMTDRDIIDLICATFDLSPLEAVERLSSIDFAAARAEHEVAA